MYVKGRISHALSAMLAVTLVAGLFAPGAAQAIITPPPPVTAISGVVTDADTGLPVQGIEVWLEKGSGLSPACFASAVTDASGRYSFAGIPAGYQYWIVIGEPAGYGAYESALMPYTGTPIVHDVVLEPLAAVARGFVTAGGEAAVGVKVKLWHRAAEGHEEWVDYLWTGDDGAYAFYADEPEAGTYFIRVYDSAYELVLQSDDFTFDGATPVDLDIDLGDAPERIADQTRHATSVEIGREGHDPAGDKSWPGVSSVVIASGDDRFSADPLTSASLCGALDAPLFLVSSSFVPYEVKVAISEIVASNGPITVYVVGGEASVPQARLDYLAAHIGADKLTFERISGANRYETAAEVAREVISLSGAPEAVLVANGARAASFYDALALAPVAAAQGFPVLLVGESSVPGASQSVLDALPGVRVIAAGGTSAVSDTVVTSLGAERWSGRSRYDTAVAIATNAENEGWLGSSFVGIAAKLPDALSGGSFCGSGGGVLLLTDGTQLSTATRDWLEDHDQVVSECVVFGGEASMHETVRGQIDAALALGISELP